MHNYAKVEKAILSPSRCHRWTFFGGAWLAGLAGLSDEPRWGKVSESFYWLPGSRRRNEGLGWSGSGRGAGVSGWVLAKRGPRLRASLAA